MPIIGTVIRREVTPFPRFFRDSCDSGPMNQAESGSNILKPPLHGVV